MFSSPMSTRRAGAEPLLFLHPLTGFLEEPCAGRRRFDDLAGVDDGVTSVEGAVILNRPRLLQVDGIYCEAALAGFLIYMRNQDVPGVIGHVGTVLGRNRINIANFSLGRREGKVAAVLLAQVAIE